MGGDLLHFLFVGVLLLPLCGPFGVQAPWKSAAVRSKRGEGGPYYVGSLPPFGTAFHRDLHGVVFLW
jgi:hypothetical protein